jgi:hypothetical protein
MKRIAWRSQFSVTERTPQPLTEHGLARLKYYIAQHEEGKLDGVQLKAKVNQVMAIENR